MSLNTFLARQFADPTGLGGRLVAVVMNQQNRRLYEDTLRLVNVCDTDAVLDVGCGNGFMLGLFGARTRARLAGIDMSPDMLKSCAWRNRRLISEGRLTVKDGDAAHLPSRMVVSRRCIR